MKNLPIHIYHAFSNYKMDCKGNPAAVIHLQDKMSDKDMQSIATELKHPATTFLWKESQASTYHVRWFAPDAEIGLCGHGTLAAIASVTELYNNLTDDYIHFNYKGGLIKGHKVNESEFKIIISAIPHEEQSTPPAELEQSLGIPVLEYYKTGNKDLVVTDSQESVKSMQPNFEKLKKIDRFGYAVTARSSEEDVQFVSRTLVPHVEALEDFATGSSHAILFPYWFNKLNINKATALQLSSRGGFFRAEKDDDKIAIIGQAHKALEGTYQPNL